jgi:hypothetical protein
MIRDLLGQVSRWQSRATGSRHADAVGRRLVAWDSELSPVEALRPAVALKMVQQNGEDLK